MYPYIQSKLYTRIFDNVIYKKPPFHLSTSSIQKVSVAPAVPTTPALTAADPRRLYVYGTLVVVMLPSGAVFDPEPKSLSKALTYLYAHR
jgi:hypothetical protein